MESSCAYERYRVKSDQGELGPLEPSRIHPLRTHPKHLGIRSRPVTLTKPLCPFASE